MSIRLRLGSPAGLSILFVVLAGVPLATLGWLASRLLADEEGRERQQRRELLDNSATVLSHEINRLLSAWEETGSSLNEPVPAGASRLLYDARGVLRVEGVRLPYVPWIPADFAARTAELSEGLTTEFQRHDPVAAVAAYRRVAETSPSPETRAEALVGMGRCLRRQSEPRLAVAAYQELAKLGKVLVGTFPAELVARRELADLFSAMGDYKAAREETNRLAESLLRGRFLIDRATFDVFSAALPAADGDLGRDVAVGVEELWSTFQRQGEGRAATARGERGIVAVWRRSGEASVAVVAPLDVLMSSVQRTATELRVDVGIDDSASWRLWGSESASLSVSRPLRDIGLPWTLQLRPRDATFSDRGWRSRRSLVAAGVALMALVIAAASYAVFRAVNHELSVAALQSEFVATVSHEFRTPLTAMRHLTEMLEEGGTPSDRLAQYYRALAHETRRLHRLVENLLDFGRIESGRRTYALEKTDAFTAVAQIVEEFRHSGAASQHQLEIAPVDQTFRIYADREALALALRNLLDNAVKYSPAASPISIGVRERGRFVDISVKDRGPGIPRNEQRRVLRRFVRGSAARALDVKGTGIGLAIIDRIVRAHGGRIEIESEPGTGSIFTIALPRAE